MQFNINITTQLQYYSDIPINLFDIDRIQNEIKLKNKFVQILINGCSFQYYYYFFIYDKLINNITDGFFVESILHTILLFSSSFNVKKKNNK